MSRSILRLGLASASVLALLVAGSFVAPKASAWSPFVYPYQYPGFIYPYYPNAYYNNAQPLYIRAYIPPTSGYPYSSAYASPNTYPYAAAQYATAYPRPAISVTAQPVYPSSNMPAYSSSYSTSYSNAASSSYGSSYASSYASVQVSMNSTLGSYLTGPNGMTLYTLSSDGNVGASTCFSTCAGVWPPFTTYGGSVMASSGVTGTFGVAMRSDGSQQATYNGHPLYYFSGDHAAGQTNGQGVMDEWGTWSVARP